MEMTGSGGGARSTAATRQPAHDRAKKRTLEAGRELDLARDRSADTPAARSGGEATGVNIWLPRPWATQPTWFTAQFAQAGPHIVARPKDLRGRMPMERVVRERVARAGVCSARGIAQYRGSRDGAGAARDAGDGVPR